MKKTLKKIDYAEALKEAIARFSPEPFPPGASIAPIVITSHTHPGPPFQMSWEERRIGGDLTRSLLEQVGRVTDAYEQAHPGRMEFSGDAAGATRGLEEAWTIARSIRDATGIPTIAETCSDQRVIDLTPKRETPRGWGAA